MKFLLQWTKKQCLLLTPKNTQHKRITTGIQQVQ